MDSLCIKSVGFFYFAYFGVYLCNYFGHPFGKGWGETPVSNGLYFQQKEPLSLQPAFIATQNSWCQSQTGLGTNQSGAISASTLSCAQCMSVRADNFTIAFPNPQPSSLPHGGSAANVFHQQPRQNKNGKGNRISIQNTLLTITHDVPFAVFLFEQLDLKPH